MKILASKKKAPPPPPKPEPRAKPEPDVSPVKVSLVNTEQRAETLLRKLKRYEGYVGFDTEVVGPQLRDRDFVNVSYSTLLGLSLAFEDKKTFYVPVRHRGNNVSFMNLHRICSHLQELGKADRLFAHNANFDHQVMIRAGYPLQLLDSMVAAWLVTGKNFGLGLKQLALEELGRESPELDPAIGSKTGDQVKLYAGHDALNTLQLGMLYESRMTDEQWEWFLQECKFARILAEIKLQGFNLDRKGLQALRTKAVIERNRLKMEWDQAGGKKVSITSAKQLQELFIEGTWLPQGYTPGGAYLTGDDVMQYNEKYALHSAGRELARIRIAYQEVSKIVTTYTDGLIEEALQWADKKLHPDLFHFGTVTGRLSAANPNIQNQPAHGDWAKKVRECFIPDPGMEFTSADYSQVELRYFANYCGGKLAEAFRSGLDLHQMTADAMGITRQLAKTVNFGFLLYGGGPKKLARELECSVEAAEEKIASLQDLYPEVEEWRQKVITGVSERGPIPWTVTLAGRIRYIPELMGSGMRNVDPEGYQALVNKYRARCRAEKRTPSEKGIEMSVRSRGDRLVVNYLVQGGCRDLLVLGMNQYREEAPKDFTIVTTVHDEVLTQHPRGYGEEARALLKRCLESAGPKLGLKVPIVAEPKTGATWAEVK